MNSRTGSSPMRNGWRSSPTAAIGRPCSGSRRDGRRCSRKAGAAPLYWEEREDGYWSMTLRGAQPVDPDAPVTPCELLTRLTRSRPGPAEGCRASSSGSMRRLASRCAETSSTQDACARRLHKPDRRACVRSTAMCGSGRAAPSRPIRAFKPAEGAVGEYNGKFMCGQFVLRGGSCATPVNHMRPSYRNFFPPDARWQFSGLRLAGDA